jgi:hypothetical protein
MQFESEDGNESFEKMLAELCQQAAEVNRKVENQTPSNIVLKFC